MTRTRPVGRTLRFIILLLARWTCPNNRPTYPTYLMCRIGTAKFFTLLLLLYHTSVKSQGMKQLMAGGGVQKIYMVLLREPSRRDRSGSDLFHLRDGFEIRVYLKTVNMPKQRVFSACCAPFSLVIHKVFLRKNGFIRRKIPRCWSYSRFSDRP